MVWHLSDSASRVFSWDDDPPIYLNEQIPFLDAIDDFSPTFSHFFPNSTFYTLKSGGRTHGSHGSHGSHRTRRAGPHESGGRTEPRVLSLLDRSLGPAARPITAPILGSLVKRITRGYHRLECPIFSISMKLYVFFLGFLGGTSILTHIQMWKLVHKCLVC